MKDPFEGLQLTNWIDGGQERPNKRRSLGEANIIPDLQVAQVQKGLAFVAIVDLACLSPYWGKGLAANRSIDAGHIDSLVKELSKTDRRYDPANRCQASLPEEMASHILASWTGEEVKMSRNQSACQPADLPVLDLNVLLREFDPIPNLRLEAGQATNYLNCWDLMWHSKCSTKFFPRSLYTRLVASPPGWGNDRLDYCTG
jgi:hypothetical protein